jgi:hypothetical protein
MAYIGNRLADSYTSFAKQDFTTSATTSYTLDNAVTNENEIALFINFVRQEPTTAYTASGTTLTLTSATSASDDMYCVFLGKALQTVNPPAGSVGLSQLSATGTKDSTTFLRGDNTFASAGLSYFQARLASSQTSITSNTATKVAYDTEDYDTASSFDLSTDRFTPANSTVWLLQADIVAGRSNDTEAGEIYLYKNGSSLLSRIFFADPAGSVSANQMGGTIQFIVTGNGSDYYEIYGRADLGNDADTATFYSSNFTGIKLN